MLRAIPEIGRANIDNHPIKTVGIAGGGQLAQMMLPAARALGLRVVVLDPDQHCSAANESDGVVVGDFGSEPALQELARKSDVITFEIEKINVDALSRLEHAGHRVRPSAQTLRVIQDKLVQKEFLAEHQIPTSAFEAWDHGAPFARALPCVWKARRGGYDGRGVQIVRDLDAVKSLPPIAGMLEDLVPLDRELAIMVARDASGDIRHYPVVEILMDDDSHVMDSLIVPAKVSEAIAARCRELAAQVVSALDYVGVLALEFFLERDGNVLVNELSPRPHNSGHYTIEAAATSQFEQHLRAVADLGLGSVELTSAAVTFNVLGAANANGDPAYIGFDRHSPADEIFIHCYDKPAVRPGRKMGHVTVLGRDREHALQKSAAIRGEIRVESKHG